MQIYSKWRLNTSAAGLNADSGKLFFAVIQIIPPVKMKASYSASYHLIPFAIESISDETGTEQQI